MLMLTTCYTLKELDTTVQKMGFGAPVSINIQKLTTEKSNQVIRKSVFNAFFFHLAVYNGMIGM